MGNGEATDPILPLDLVERVLEKLGLRERPSLDLAGLNAVMAAVCGAIPFDNIRKRIWFERIRKGPLPGGDPTDFFESWLAHGTAGTCWPSNGAMHALLVSLGFPARRGAGGMMVTPEEDTNHGTVLVALDGVDYLADLNLGSFKALPLVPGKSDSTGEDIHGIRAVPFEDRFEVIWYMGHSRKRPLTFRIQPEHDGASHAFFLSRYERTKQVSPFNQVLYITRHFPNSILALGGMTKFAVSADGSMAATEIDAAERMRILVEELGISEEIARKLPDDVAEGTSLVDLT